MCSAILWSPTMSGNTPEEEKAAFGQRLRQALQAAGHTVSATVVATAFNGLYWGRPISVHAARNWIMGMSIPQQDKLVVLARWLHVDPHELRFGPAQRLQEGTTWDRLNLQERFMVERLLTLKPEQRRAVCEIVEGLALLQAAERR